MEKSKEKLEQRKVTFEPASKRLLWGSMILSDHSTLQEVMEYSRSTNQSNPNELSILNRPAHVQNFLLKAERFQSERQWNQRWNNRSRHFHYGQTWDKTPFASEGENVRSDLECAMAVVRDDGLTLHHMSSELQDSEFLVLTALKQNGLALQFASSRLQDADFVVSAGLKQNGLSLQYASSRLQDAHPMVLAAVKQDGLALKHASSRLQDNDDIVWHAVKQNGLALQLASSRLRDENQIATKAVMQNGYALEFVSSRLQDEWWLVYFAFRQDTRTQKFASARIRLQCAL